MNLLELARRHPQQPADGVPAWMLGHFRRRSIDWRLPAICGSG